MFADAYETATDFMAPVVLSRRDYHGECASGIGAFVILNRDGWALTAAHILEHRAKLMQSKAAFDEFLDERAEIRQNDELTETQQKRRIENIADKDDLTRNWSDWWGGDPIQIAAAAAIPSVDIAVVRLEPFNPDDFDQYPRIKDPASLRPGTSLVRIGYPLHEIEPTFDEGNDVFRMPQNNFPPPLFPVEGIFTRNIEVGEHDAGFPLKFIETSSPGLKGQSGGPLLDRHGTLWGIQSQTQHFPLGFQPEVEVDGESQVEHQFLNAGWAVHPETIVGFLEDLNLDYEVATEQGD